MPLWGVADNNASEPKNLSTGEFQGTAGKVIYGVCLLYTSPSPRD